LNDSRKAPVPEKPRGAGATPFDPSIVSEALWAQWQQTVIDRNLGGEKLGRLAPTLQALPTVIWHIPLEQYVNHTVAEIRQLKTHGEKRVRVVLEVFYTVHEMLVGCGNDQHLALRVVPKFIVPIENWIAGVLKREELPSVDEMRECLTAPLLKQINVDAGSTIYELSAGRLGSVVRRKASANRPSGWGLPAPGFTSCSRIAAASWRCAGPRVSSGSRNWKPSSWPKLPRATICNCLAPRANCSIRANSACPTRTDRSRGNFPGKRAGYWRAA
jgi:hypothetical protein